MPSEWKDGRLHPDQTPVEIPLKYKQSITEAQRIAHAVSMEFSKQADKGGYETLEDTLDFDVEEDEDIFPASQWELTEMQEEFLYNPPEQPSDMEKTRDEVALEELENAPQSKKENKPEESERENPTEPR